MFTFEKSSADAAVVRHVSGERRTILHRLISDNWEVADETGVVACCKTAAEAYRMAKEDLAGVEPPARRKQRDAELELDAALEDRFMVRSFNLQEAVGSPTTFEDFLNGLPATHDLRFMVPGADGASVMAVLERARQSRA